MNTEQFLEIKKNRTETLANLRKQLEKIMRNEPKSMTAWSKELGVATQTLMGFLHGNTRIGYRFQCCIENFLTERNK